MTYTELQKKIAHLETELTEVKEKIAALPKRVDGGVFKPEDGQNYWSIMAGGDVAEEWWNDNLFDHGHYAIGNCFPSRESAEDAVRALKLIQKAKNSQAGYVPDWEGSTQDKYLIYFDGRRVDSYGFISLNTAPIFGFWEDKSVCEQFIDENREEVLWFFMEYHKQ